MGLYYADTFVLPLPAGHRFPMGKYLRLRVSARGVVPPDPWGHAYVYRAPGQEGRTYDLLSYGADGTEGGAGAAQDITSWQR